MQPQIARRRIADLDCHVLTSGEEITNVAIFCHGFGAPGTDLVPLGEELLRAIPELKGYQFIFPAAPIDMTEYGLPGGRAWWMIDMVKLQQAAEQGDFRDLRKESPDELPDVRKSLMALIEEVHNETRVPMSQFVLGGFSQGSMLATDVTLHLENKPGGLIVWSGTLLNEDVWRPRISTLSELPIMQSHGRQDPILPFEAAQWLHQMFEEGGAHATFVEFQGGHAIPAQAFMGAAELLKQVSSHV